MCTTTLLNKQALVLPYCWSTAIRLLTCLECLRPVQNAREMLILLWLPLAMLEGYCSGVARAQ